MTIEEIKRIIADEEYDVYGLRMDNADYEVGDICENSCEWWQDDPEDGSEYNEELHLWKGEELDGTCAIKVNAANIEEALKKVQHYNLDGKMYLIAGYDWEEGNDDGEVVIRDAHVISI